MENIKHYYACWSNALSKLDIRVAEISAEELGIKSSFETLPLLKNFGGKNGMLLFPDGSKVLPHHDILLDQGYCYSVIGSPSLEIENFESDLISLLKDWSWTGAQCDKPRWL